MRRDTLLCTFLVVFYTSLVQADACSDWLNHVSYWRLDQGGLDGDIVRGAALRTACDLQDPCGQFERHSAYWAARGIGPFDINGDALRGGALDLACKAKTQVFDPATQWVQKTIIDPTVGFLNDVLAGRMPAAFQLQGKLSNEVKKVPGILTTNPDSIANQARAIPSQVSQLYKQLAMNNYTINLALIDIVANKKTVDEQIEKYTKDMKLTQTLKANLLSALNKLKDTLPKIEAILRQLQQAIQTVIPLDNGPINKTRAEYEAYIKNDVPAYVDAQTALRMQSIQQSAQNVLNALESKNFNGHTLSQALEIIGNELYARNL